MLTCGFREPYLGRLLAKPPKKTREGRRMYESAGCRSPVWRILQSLRTLKHPGRRRLDSRISTSRPTIWGQRALNT